MTPARVPRNQKRLRTKFFLFFFLSFGRIKSNLRLLRFMYTLHGAWTKNNQNICWLAVGLTLFVRLSLSLSTFELNSFNCLRRTPGIHIKMAFTFKCVQNDDVRPISELKNFTFRSNYNHLPLGPTIGARSK